MVILEKYTNFGTKNSQNGLKLVAVKGGSESGRKPGVATQKDGLTKRVLL